ncbi:hypothetical protein [Streptomyces sp. AC550_RSS872]|uniref:hypothetical protein n=1 Tax=Streptomyces sp. AC550_RSS872 TaxID=2823689 RepID=UPI0035ABD97B
MEAERTEDAIQRITTENTTLKQRVRQLTADNRTLDERLKAARSNLRFQVRSIADREAQITDPLHKSNRRPPRAALAPLQMPSAWVHHNVGVESGLGTALIAFIATLAGAVVSLIGVIWQQKQNEKAAETNRRTALREAGLERIAEELFPRAHIVRLEDGTEVKLGVLLSNTKTRRAKLTADKLAALAELGLEWAA